MGIVKDVSIKIVGQVSGDYQDNDYKIMLAELTVICAKYGLDLDEVVE